MWPCITKDQSIRAARKSFLGGELPKPRKGRGGWWKAPKFRRSVSVGGFVGIGLARTRRSIFWLRLCRYRAMLLGAHLLPCRHETARPCAKQWRGGTYLTNSPCWADHLARWRVGASEDRRRCSVSAGFAAAADLRVASGWEEIRLVVSTMAARSPRSAWMIRPVRLAQAVHSTEVREGCPTWRAAKAARLPHEKRSAAERASAA
jgi:hypothetical protein